MSDLKRRRVQIIMELFELDREIDTIIALRREQEVREAASRRRMSERYREGFPVVDLTFEFSEL